MSGGPSRKALWKDILTCGVVILISGVTRGQDDPTTSTTPGKMFKFHVYSKQKHIWGGVRWACLQKNAVHIGYSDWPPSRGLLKLPFEHKLNVQSAAFKKQKEWRTK